MTLMTADEAYKISTNPHPKRTFPVMMNSILEDILERVKAKAEDGYVGCIYDDGLFPDNEDVLATLRKLPLPYRDGLVAKLRELGYEVRVSPSTERPEVIVVRWDKEKDK